MNFSGSLSASGIACMGVGGGALTNTLGGRFVLRNGKKPHALFIKRKGNLANSNEQAIVPVQLGDLVLTFEGLRPATHDNPDILVGCFKIVGIETLEEGKLSIHTEVTARPDGWENEVPWEALGTYHNRDGKPFTA